MLKVLTNAFMQMRHAMVTLTLSNTSYVHTSRFLRFYVLIDIIPNYLLALHLNIRWPLSNDRRADRHAVQR